MNSKYNKLITVLLLVWLVVLVAFFYKVAPEHDKKIRACQHQCAPHRGWPENDHCVCDLTKEVR